MKKHILIITHKFFPIHRGGTEVLTLELAKGLRNEGFRVSILTGEPHYFPFPTIVPFHSIDEYDGFDVHRIHYFGFQVDPIKSHYDCPDRVQVVLECIRALSPDLVHINHFLGLSAALIPRIKMLGLPVVFVPTDYFVICRTYQLYRWAEKQVCNGPEDGNPCKSCQAKHGFKDVISTPSAIRSVFSLARASSFSDRLPRMIEAVNMSDRIFPSTRFLGQLLIQHGIDQLKVRAIPYGVDIGVLPEHVVVPEKFDSKNKLRIGFIGTLSEAKGLHVVLNSLELLDEKDRARIECYVYGAGISTQLTYYSELMKKMQLLGDSVKFMGTFPHEEIGSILRNIHVLIVPSIWYESIPLVLQSALNSGTPVIVSELGGLTEVFDNGYSGFSFPSGNETGLLGVLQSIVTNPAQLQILRQELDGKQRTTVDYVNEMIRAYSELNVCEKVISN